MIMRLHKELDRRLYCDRQDVQLLHNCISPPYASELGGGHFIDNLIIKKKRNVMNENKTKHKKVD